MALMKFHGNDIAGGGLSVIQMTTAEYLANKATLDASDLIVELTDDETSADATDVNYTAGVTVKEALDDINAVNDASLVEALTPTVPTLLVGSIYSDRTFYYKKGTKVIMAIGVQGLTEGTSTQILFTLPQGYRPYKNIGLRGTGLSFDNDCAIFIYTNGNVSVRQTVDGGAFGYIEFDAFN